MTTYLFAHISFIYDTLQACFNLDYLEELKIMYWVYQNNHIDKIIRMYKDYSSLKSYWDMLIIINIQIYYKLFFFII